MRKLALLLPFVVVSFAANSLITRFVVARGLLDAGLLGATRFAAGAAVLVAVALGRGERTLVRRAHLLPALWLGIYTVCICYGYLFIGAAAGTVVFYCAVLVTLNGYDRFTSMAVGPRRLVGAAVALAGVAVLVTAVALGPAAVGVAAGLHVTAAGLAWAAAMGAVPTALAYIAWYACQRSMSATTAGTVQLVIPILTAAGAVALLGEPLSVALFVAAALVAAGMWLARPPSPVAPRGG